MRTPPTIIDPGAISAAERSALLLDGDCVELGLALLAAGPPPDRADRAASLAPATARHDLVADLLTAAWVHGAAAELPERPTFAVDVRRGRTTRALDGVREARLDPGDMERIAGVRVTTPLKTAFDLLRLADDVDPALLAVARALLRLTGRTPTVAAALAHLQPRCPHKQRGIERLAALGAVQPADTR